MLSIADQDDEQVITGSMSCVSQSATDLHRFIYLLNSSIRIPKNLPQSRLAPGMSGKSVRQEI
jgi:hypothetical protein